MGGCNILSSTRKPDGTSSKSEQDQAQMISIKPDFACEWMITILAI
jgi:hypothetical protein